MLIVLVRNSNKPSRHTTLNERSVESTLIQLLNLNSTLFQSCLPAGK
jgi:hypothetical protein